MEERLLSGVVWPPLWAGIWALGDFLLPAIFLAKGHLSGTYQRYKNRSRSSPRGLPSLKGVGGRAPLTSGHQYGQREPWSLWSSNGVPNPALGRIQEGFLEERTFELQWKEELESLSQGKWKRLREMRKSMWLDSRIKKTKAKKITRPGLTDQEFRFHLKGPREPRNVLP